jgi:hypothetical protein
VDVTTDRSAGSAPRPGVLIVLTDVDAAAEDEFNHWYDTEHVPERVAIAGVKGARRYVRTDDGPQPAPGTVAVRRGPKYLVVYELDDLAVLDGEWSQLMARHSATSHQMYVAMGNTLRDTYQLIGEFAGAP